MDDKKKKYAYWMRPSLVKEMESALKWQTQPLKQFCLYGGKLLYRLPSRAEKHQLSRTYFSKRHKEEVKLLESNLSVSCFRWRWNSQSSTI